MRSKDSSRISLGWKNSSYRIPESRETRPRLLQIKEPEPDYLRIRGHDRIFTGSSDMSTIASGLRNTGWIILGSKNFGSRDPGSGNKCEIAPCKMNSK